MVEFTGLKWISERTGIVPVQPFTVESAIGTVRKTVPGTAGRLEFYTPALRPDATIPHHLTFAFKYETLHLEFLARLFQAIDPAIIEAWVRTEPSGQYARRAGFLFEWLTTTKLDVPDVTSGNYVDALPPERYFVATRSINVRRWRVRDNLPGTRDYCPIIARDSKVANVEQYQCNQALQELELSFGADILLRSAMWLTVKESKASFAIEKEDKQVDRIQRFASAMERWCGQNDDSLSDEALQTLQSEILGVATRYGARRSPVFVGHNASYQNVIDYIAPHWNDTASLLSGLRTSMARTIGQSSILRAAVASFGFVYIHPMSDGNGRISRFLVNDTLRRDGAVPPPFILPISATITNKVRERVGYDQALEIFSKPLMAAYGEKASFGTAFICDDGVETNFHFAAYEEALPAWRYPNLSAHAAYLGDIIKITIEVEMRNEAMFLRNFDTAREGVKNWLEGPNTDIDRIIRSISHEGRWEVSNKLVKEFPQLDDAGRAQNIVAAVRRALDPSFKNDAANESDQD